MTNENTQLINIEPYHGQTVSVSGGQYQTENAETSNIVLAGGVSKTVSFDTPALSNITIGTKNRGSNIITSAGSSHATNVLDHMRQIEWSRGYSWDVFIDPAPPAPFNSTRYGLPVVEVKDHIAYTRPWDIDAGCSTYRMPKGKALFDISLSFLDDEVGTMEQYFEKWFEQICPWEGRAGSDGCVSYLEDIVRQIRITKVNSKKQAIFTRRYYVYPDGEIVGYNNSVGGVRTYTVILTVAGYLGKTN